MPQGPIRTILLAWWAGILDSITNYSFLISTKSYVFPCKFPFESEHSAINNMPQLFLASELAGKLAPLRVKLLINFEEFTLFWYLYSCLLFKLLEFMMQVRLINVLLNSFYFKNYIFWFWRWIETNLVALESLFRALQFYILWKFCNSNIY
jgi:hypothetical protein